MVTAGRLSAEEARRVALAAQGFGAPRPSAKPTLAHVRKAAHGLHALQIDAVNVLVRAHYLPVYSRLGPYPVSALDRLTNVRHELIEVRHGHQASFVPVELEPLLRWKREEARERWRSTWRASVDAGYLAEVERQVVDRGPLALSDLEDARRRPKPAPSDLAIRRRDGQPYAASSLLWGRPSDGKTVLDGLLSEGRLALAGRRGFDRLYDLAERVIPDGVRLAATPPAEDARRELVRRSASALGVATVVDLAHYFELRVADTRAAVRDLVDDGTLVAVAVEGWKAPAFVAGGGAAAAAKPLAARSLLGPFDSLTWSRDRTKRIFDYTYSFEIYVPVAKRRYGYYVLPFLLGDTLVARVDLLADRARSTLVVAGAYAEARADGRVVAPALGDELRLLGSWLGLERVVVADGGRGDLAPLLERALRRKGS